MISGRKPTETIRFTEGLSLGWEEKRRLDGESAPEKYENLKGVESEIRQRCNHGMDKTRRGGTRFQGLISIVCGKNDDIWTGKKGGKKFIKERTYLGME